MTTLEPTTLVEGFEFHARSQGWDTHAGSTGRCWYIARAFAEYATERGHDVELWRVTNPRSTRPADDVNNFAVVDGWAVDFASRGSAGGDVMHWPAAAPLDDYLLAYGARLPLCSTCARRAGALATSSGRT